ncbi:MAG: type II toxin-antitoxin system HicB family antitoxin [Defluviitaleaceae bacterium]|nr:type II toxin-antitoxin system HicB family antitoxin [Defluviitaleaceae bacterium]MCL2239009.1 type II toxin-antitoxin system HicB family antitoxin [Defluviitaleaceae bacterium]
MQYSILIQYDDIDKIYVASVPELKGCMAHGDTREEAIREIQEAIQLQLEVMHNKGIFIPKPMIYTSQQAG